MKTVLYDQHIALGAKIVDFCHWQMPILYTGMMEEHRTVRNAVGIFDVSHMGRIEVIGPDAERFLDYLSTNSIANRDPFSATYTVLPNDFGGSVDDVMIYKESSQNLFIIVNAGNREKDLAHLIKESKAFEVKIISHYQDEGILSIQGPRALELGRKIFSDCPSLKQMEFVSTHYQGYPLIFSRTGYTGELGFELSASNEIIPLLWEECLKAGKPLGIAPIGLGARDTLRLEMGYALYGSELKDEISATESVAAWTVKMKGRTFIGQKNLGRIRHSYGIILIDKGIARAGYSIYDEEDLVGEVTSGNFSPSLNQAIALIIVNRQYDEGKILHVKIRERWVKAEIVKLPFYKKGL